MRFSQNLLYVAKVGRDIYIFPQLYTDVSLLDWPLNGAFGISWDGVENKNYPDELYFILCHFMKINSMAIYSSSYHYITNKYWRSYTNCIYLGSDYFHCLFLSVYPMLLQS